MTNTVPLTTAVVPPISEQEVLAKRSISENQAAVTSSYAAMVTDQENYAVARDNYRETIAIGKEEEIRQTVATQKLEEDLQALKVVGEEAFLESNLELIEDIIRFETVKQIELKDAALEEAAIEKFSELAITDPVQAEVFAETYGQDDSTFFMIEDYNKKMAYFSRLMDEVAESAEGRSVPRVVWDFLGSLLPANMTTAESGLSDADGGFLFDVAANIRATGVDLFRSSEAFNEEWVLKAQAIRDQAIEQSGYIAENLDQAYESMSNMVTDPRGKFTEGDYQIFSSRNILSVLDMPGPYATAALAYKVLKGGASAAAGMAGHKLMQAQLTAEAVTGASDTVSKAQAVKNALPRSTKAKTGDDHTVGLSGKVQEVLEHNQTLLQHGEELLRRTGFLTSDDLEAAVNRLRSSKSYDNRLVDILDVDEAGTISVLLGRKGREAFSTLRGAEAAAKSMNLPKKKFTIEKLGDTDAEGYVIKLKDQKLPTDGVIQAANLNDVGKFSGVLRWVLSPDHFTPKRLVESIQNSQFIHQAINKQIIKPMIKKLGKLSRAEQKTMIRLGEAGQRWVNPDGTQGKWLSIDEIADVLGRKATDNELIGYYTLKDLNDYDWTVRNHAMRTELEHAGWKKFIHEDTKIHTLAQEVKGYTGEVYDPKTGKLLTRPLTKDDTIFKLYEPYDIEGGKIKAIVLTSKDKKVYTDLPGKVLNYQGGGHRIYEGKFFVKQAVLGTSLGNIKYVSNPVTHMVAKTKEEAAEWADDWEFARQIVNRVKDGKASIRSATIELRERPSFVNMNYRQVEDFFDNGKANRHQPFEVTFDKEPPETMKELLNKHPNWAEESTGIAQQYRTQGRLFYSKRGEHLPEPGDEFATTLDIFESTSKALNNSMRVGSLTNYRIEALETWWAAARGELDQTYSNATDAFLHGNIRQGSAKKTRLDTIRRTIQNHLEQQTIEGRKLQEVRNSMERWVLETDKLPDQAKRPFLWALDRNPVRAMRAIAFDTKLGFFDPSQLIVQTQTAVAAVALSPKHGMQALTSATALRIAMKNQSDEMLNHLANNWKGSGIEGEEFKQMVKVLKESGIMDVGGEIAYLNNMADNISLNFSKHIRNMRDHSRILFFEAEKWNRLVGYGIAWREIRKANPNLDMTSVEALRKLSKRTNDYAMNMTQASGAEWQRGFLSLAGQFKAYQFRLMENMFVGDFTAAQKLRLGASQLFLYGAMGIPGVEYVLDKVMLDPSKEKHILETGFMDSLIFGPLVGNDTSFASRVGVGRGFSELFDDLANGKFAEVILGPSAQIAFLGNNDIATSIYSAAKMFGAENVSMGTMTKNMFLKIARNISSFSRGEKAIYTAMYGQIFDSNMTAIGEAVSMEWLAAALGIQMKEVDDIWKLTDQTKTIQEFEKIIYKDVLRLRNEGLLNPDLAEEHGEIIATMLAPLPYARRIALLKRLNGDPAFKDAKTIAVQNNLNALGRNKWLGFDDEE